MRSAFRPILPVLVLPLLHLIFCIYAEFFSRWEGGWTYFPLFIMDLPFSLILMFLVYLVPSNFAVFGILGTLWWFVIGVLARWIVKGWNEP